MAVLTVPMEQMSATVRIEKFIHLTVLKGFSVNPISLFAMVGDVLTCHQGAMVAPIVLMGAMSATVHRLKFQALTTLTACSVPLSNLFAISGDVLTSR